MKQLNLFDYENYEEAGIYESDEYIVTACNRHIYEYVSCIKNWVDHLAMVRGPSFSGKTHLANLSSRRNQGVIISGIINNYEILQHINYVVIDEVTDFEDELMFHLFNYLRSHRKFVLFISHCDYNPKLLDLKSRFNAIPTFDLNNPDDELIRNS